MNIIAFVHAKKESVRIPNKNLKMLGDKPLFCHSIRNAIGAILVNKVVVDSNSDKILGIGEKYGAVPLKRDDSLASNKTTGDDLAYWQAKNYPDSDIVLQVVPTSPFIKPSSINDAIKLLIDSQADSVVGVHSDVFYKWINGQPVYYKAGKIPNSFDITPTIYETTGLYINRTKFVLEQQRRINASKCLPFFLSRIESVDINRREDFELASFLWAGMKETIY